MRTAKPCGPDAPRAGVKLAMMLAHHAGDGGKKAGHQGEHGISRKAIAQGRPDCLRFTCLLMCVLFCCPLHMRPRVRRAPGLPRALSQGSRTNLKNSGEKLSRE